MRLGNGARAATVNRDPRLFEILLGNGNNQTDSPHSHNPQLKSPRADFARELTAAVGPRLASQVWVRFSREAAR